LGLIPDSTLFINAERTGKTPSDLGQELIGRYRDQTLADDGATPVTLHPAGVSGAVAARTAARGW
jgi:hypothetical protein